MRRLFQFFLASVLLGSSAFAQEPLTPACWVRAAVAASHEFSSENALEDPEHEIQLHHLATTFWERFGSTPSTYAWVLQSLARAGHRDSTIAHSYFYQGLWIELQNGWTPRHITSSHSTAAELRERNIALGAVLLLARGSALVPQVRLTRAVILGALLHASPEAQLRFPPPLSYLSSRLADIQLPPPRWLVPESFEFGQTAAGFAGGFGAQSAARIGGGAALGGGLMGLLVFGAGMAIGELAYDVHTTSDSRERLRRMLRQSTQALARNNLDAYEARLHAERVKTLIDFERMSAMAHETFSLPRHAEILLHDWSSRRAQQARRIGAPPTRGDSTLAIERHWHRIMGPDVPVDWSAMIGEQERAWAERWSPSINAEYDAQLWAWKKVWLGSWLRHNPNAYAQQIGSQILTGIDELSAMIHSRVRR